MIPPPRRILYVESNVDQTIGGSYYSLLYLASGLDRNRFEPIVVFATDNALIGRFKERGIRTIIRKPLPPVIFHGSMGRKVSKCLNFMRGFILEPVRIARLLRREGISLVHLNNSIVRNDTWMMGSLLARLPCITHERGINSHFQPRVRMLARSLDAVICISKAVRDNLVSHRLGNLKLVTLYNGLDPAEIQVTKSAAEIRDEFGIDSSARLIGVVGNIKKWKGQDLIVRAIARLRDLYPDITCLLIGDAPADNVAYRSEIDRLIRDSGLADRVRITGYRHDVGNYINALEIQVHSSLKPEPFGRVLLEAMALGKPLIASNSGAVPEIVIDGTTGLLFEPGSEDALCACLKALLSDPHRAQAMGREGRSRMERHFSVASNVKDTTAIYDRILQSPNDQGPDDRLERPSASST